ncbi:MAG: hypothetical protein Q8M16_09675 [Pirellulaceae bacterium]|nr:hypothetical protein [Pirellulaceae bacterium]
MNHRPTDMRCSKSALAVPGRNRVYLGGAQDSPLRRTREPQWKAVEGQTYFANEIIRDRNGLRPQARVVRTHNQNRLAYLRSCLKQARSYGL